MRPFLKLGALAVLIPLASACDDTPDVKAYNAWLAVSDTYFDFGEIPHGEKREHVFWVENTSTQRIRLTSIRSNCSCARVKPRVMRDGQPVPDRPIHDPPRMVQGGFLTTWLEAGERLEVRVLVDTTLRPPADHVEPAKSELMFEPQEAGSIVFAYRMKIRARMNVTGDLVPGQSPIVALGEFSKDQEALSVLEVSPRDGKQFRIKGIEGTDDRLVLEKREPHDPGGYRWLVKVLPNGKPGPFERELRIKTDLPGDYVLPVTVSGVALPNLRIVPFRDIHFGRIPFSKAKRGFVTLVYGRPAVDPKFAIGRTEVKSRDGTDVRKHFEFGLEDVGLRRWTLSVRYKGGLKAKGFAGWVQLKSNDPEHESTVLRFTGYNTES